MRAIIMQPHILDRLFVLWILGGSKITRSTTPSRISTGIFITMIALSLSLSLSNDFENHIVKSQILVNISTSLKHDGDYCLGLSLFTSSTLRIVLVASFWFQASSHEKGKVWHSQHWEKQDTQQRRDTILCSSLQRQTTHLVIFVKLFQKDSFMPSYNNSFNWDLGDLGDY